MAAKGANYLLDCGSIKRSDCKSPAWWLAGFFAVWLLKSDRSVNYISLHRINANEPPISAATESSLWVNVLHMPGSQSKREWERVRGGQTVCQAASHAIIHPDGQTDNMPWYCSPSRWRGSAAYCCCFSETVLRRNNYRARASGGLCCWPSNRRHSVVTGVHVVCLRFCPSPRLQYLVSILSTENSPSQKLFGSWTWSISHALNSAHPEAFNNAGVIPP